MYEFLSYRVEDAMTPSPVTVTSTVTLAEAQEIFEKCDFNALPVVDTDGELVGVLTKLDILRAFRFTDQSMFPSYERIMASTVGDAMQCEVETVTPRTPLTRVLEQLVQRGYKAFVVLEGQQPVGMISREDVLGAVRRATSGEPGSGSIAFD
jgi:CBS domain-containing protein